MLNKSARRSGVRLIRNAISPISPVTASNVFFERPYHVTLQANKNESPRVPVCTVTPMTTGRRSKSSLPSASCELLRDGARTDREVQRRKSAKQARQIQTEPKRPDRNDPPLQAAIFDLLNYRPSTPVSSRGIPNTDDAITDYSKRYRLMYLVVRAEQQQDHLRDVIASMRNHGNSKENIRLMIKIKEALLKLYAQMLGIRDNDPVVIQQIGNEADIEEFFCMVENTCSAIEDIPKDGYTEDIAPRLKLDTDARHPHIGEKSPDTRAIPGDWISMFADHPSPGRLTVNESNNSNELRASSSKETNSSTNGDSREAKADTYGSKLLHRGEGFTTSHANKNRLYRVAKYDQDQGIYPCTYDEFDDDVTQPPTPPSAAMVPVSQMPTLHSMTKQDDPQLHSLMREIDGLLIDVGVAENTKAGISFEELMWNKGKGNRERKMARKKDGPRKAPTKTEEDNFIEALDRLLDDADT